MTINTFKNNTLYANVSFNREMLNTYVGLCVPSKLNAYFEKTKKFITKGKTDVEAEKELLKYQRAFSKRVANDIAQKVSHGTVINNSIHILISRKDGRPVEVKKVAFPGGFVYQIELPDINTPEADDYLVFIFDGQHRFMGMYQAWCDNNGEDYYEATAVYYVDMKLSQSGTEFKNLNCGRRVTKQNQEYIDHYNADLESMTPSERQDYDIFESLVKMSQKVESPLFNRLNYGQEVTAKQVTYRLKYFTDNLCGTDGLSEEVASDFEKMFNGYLYAVESSTNAKLGTKGTLSQAYKIVYANRLFNKLSDTVYERAHANGNYRECFEKIFANINKMIENNYTVAQASDRQSVFNFVCRGTNDGATIADKDAAALAAVGIID